MFQCIFIFHCSYHSYFISGRTCFPWLRHSQLPSTVLVCHTKLRVTSPGDSHIPISDQMPKREVSACVGMETALELRWVVLITLGGDGLTSREGPNPQ